MAKWLRHSKTAWALVLRARIVLAAANGNGDREVAERWCAETTREQSRRGSSACTQELERAFREYLASCNENPEPFVWTKSADQIPKRISESGEGVSDWHGWDRVDSTRIRKKRNKPPQIAMHAGNSHY